MAFSVSIELFMCCYHKQWEHCLHLERNLLTYLIPKSLPFRSALGNPQFTFCLFLMLILESCNMWTFVTDSFYFSIVFSKCIHVIACVSSTLFAIAKGICCISFIHPWADRPLVGFYHLTIVDNDTMNILCIILMWAYVFISLNHTPRGRIAGLYGLSL